MNHRQLVSASEEKNVALAFTQVMVYSYTAICPSTTMQSVLRIHIDIYQCKEVTHAEFKNYHQKPEVTTLPTNHKVVNNICK